MPTLLLLPLLLLLLLVSFPPLDFFAAVIVGLITCAEINICVCVVVPNEDNDDAKGSLYMLSSSSSLFKVLFVFEEDEAGGMFVYTNEPFFIVSILRGVF